MEAAKENSIKKEDAPVEPKENGAAAAAAGDSNAAAAEEDSAPKSEAASPDAAEPEESKEKEKDAAVVKSEDSPPTDLEKKIIRQIEYYFGDFNLAKDKFLKEEIKKDEGWIELELMLKFNRLAILTKDTNVIVAAVDKSSSGLLEVDEDKKKIRRCPEKKLPEINSEWKSDVQNRTLYMKGFPAETLLDDIIAFVDQICQSENVVMRRYKTTFKGSIFVTYRSVEDAKKVSLEFSDKKFRDEDDASLIVKFQKDYFEFKKAEKKNAKAGRREEAEKKEAEAKESTHEKGAVLKIENLDVDSFDREDIKSAFEGASTTVAWVSFQKGDKVAKVRFDGDGSAVKTIEEFKGKLKIKDKESFDLTLLEGEEEEKYWEEYLQDRRSKASRGRGRGRGRGGGGRGGKRNFGNRGEADGDEPRSKKVKS